jgi:hypothetical protein
MWTLQRIESLAPDASSIKAARGLADPRHWSGLGQHGEVLWGLCQGSGKEPYRTHADLAKPTFGCSCPSSKFPCKHALGLLMLWGGRPALLPEAAPPSWVADAKDKRDRPAVMRQPKTTPPDPEAQARRAAQRAGRVAEGTAFLGQWLRDLMRAGLSGAPALPDKHWNDAAARLVDTQTPGLARMVRRIPELLGLPDWQLRVAEHLGRVHLLLEGYGRIEQLPPDMQAEIRTRLGWPQNQQELMTRRGLPGPWCVVGQRQFEDDNLKTLRTWLWSAQGESALLLDFAVGNQVLFNPFSAGAWYEVELVYFEGVGRQRALLKSLPVPTSGPAPQGMDGVGRFLRGYAEELARNPWLESFPALLSGLVPGETSGTLVDGAGQVLPFWPASRHWKLAALGGGSPTTVFGEWDGHRLRPLVAWGDGRAWSLEAEWTN